MPKTISTNAISNTRESSTCRSPSSLRHRAERLAGKRDEIRKRAMKVEQRLHDVTQYLGIAEQVTAALQLLSQQLFKEVLEVLQEKLTIALQEILDQPIRFCADANFKRGGAVVEFSIERDGHREDIYRAQGGSVQNILSVGLRMFALATLDQKQHRRFLVLDEQDCWLRPELVPKLVGVVHSAAKELGFQVIMISHHDIGLFEKYADRIYRFSPTGSSVQVEQVAAAPTESDAG